MHSEQSFLQSTLKGAQDSMNKQTNAFQNHLTRALGDTTDIRTSVQRQQQALDDMISAIKQHVSSVPGRLLKIIPRTTS